MNEKMKVLTATGKRHTDGREIDAWLLEDKSVVFEFTNPNELQKDGTPFKTNIRLSVDGLETLVRIQQELMGKLCVCCGEKEATCMGGLCDNCDREIGNLATDGRG